MARSGERTNIPVPVVIGGTIIVLLLGLFVWVALSMGSAPTQEEVIVDVSPKTAS